MDIQFSDDLAESYGLVQARHAIHVIETLAAFNALQSDWEALQAASEDYPLYLTYSYCKLAAERTIAVGGWVAVAMVYDGVHLLAIWPLAIHRQGMLRIANVLSCGNHEEYGGPLVKGKPTTSVSEQCVRAIMQIPADVLEIPFLQNGSLLQLALEEAPQSWVLRLLPTRLSDFPGYSVGLRTFGAWDDYASTLSQSLRRNLRRYRKGLTTLGHTEFGWCTTLDDATAVLDWLFETKRRWALARGFNTRYLMDDAVRDFFISLAAQTDLSTIPLVAFVKVDGVPVAASINLVGSRTLEYWIFTYNEAYNRYSVGNLLTEFVARWAHANSRDFDMRTMYNEYKTYWVNRETRHQTRVLVLSARGRLREIALLLFQVTRVQRRLRKACVSAFGKTTRQAQARIAK